jgi:MFS family permease
LYAGTFISKFGSFVLVFLAVYLARVGYSAAQAGIALSVYGVGALISAPVGGYLADRLGRRNTIGLSMFMSAAAMLGLSQANELALILALAALAGFTSELYRPAAAALLADLTPAGQRVPAFAMNRLAVNLGFAAGPAVGGFLARWSFSLLFIGDALTSVAFGVIALAALPRGDVQPTPSGRPNWLRVVLADRGFLVFLIASAAGALILVQAFSSFALQVSSLFDSALYGTLISLNGALIVFIELPIASWTQRQRPRRVMALGLLLLGTGFGVTLFAGPAVVLALAVVIWTLGEIAFMPVAAAYVADVAPDHMRGRYQGAWGSTFGIAFALGPALGTAFYSVSPVGLWLSCTLLGGLAALLVLTGPEAQRNWTNSAESD